MSPNIQVNEDIAIVWFPFNSENKQIYCIDLKLGQHLWKITPLSDVYSVFLHEEILYILTERELTALNARSSKEIWSFSTNERNEHGSLIFVKNRLIYFVRLVYHLSESKISMYDSDDYDYSSIEGFDDYDIQVQEFNTVDLFVFDANGRKKWSHECGFGWSADIEIFDDRLILITAEDSYSRLFIFDSKTGEIVISKLIKSRLVKVFSCRETGYLCVHQTNEGFSKGIIIKPLDLIQGRKNKWHFEYKNVILEDSVCQSESSLFFSTQDLGQRRGSVVYCIDVETGKMKWKKNDASFVNFLRLCRNFLLFVDRNKLYSVNAETGIELWNISVDARAYPDNYTVNQSLSRVVAIHERTIACIKVEDGQLLWVYRENDLSESISILADNIYQSGSFLFSLNEISGELTWRYEVDYQVNSTKITDNQILVFTETPCVIHPANTTSDKEDLTSDSVLQRVFGYLVAIDINSGRKCWDLKVAEYTSSSCNPSNGGADEIPF